MHIPGVTARHAIITDNCREMRGDEGAADEALLRIHNMLTQCMEGWGRDKDVKFHVVLSVERPAKVEVYSRPECPFQYCSDPTTCKELDRCQHVAKPRS